MLQRRSTTQHELTASGFSAACRTVGPCALRNSDAMRAGSALANVLYVSALRVERSARTLPRSPKSCSSNNQAKTGLTAIVPRHHLCVGHTYVWLLHYKSKHTMADRRTTHQPNGSSQLDDANHGGEHANARLGQSTLYSGPCPCPLMMRGIHVP